VPLPATYPEEWIPSETLTRPGGVPLHIFKNKWSGKLALQEGKNGGLTPVSTDKKGNFVDYDTGRVWGRDGIVNGPQPLDPDWASEPTTDAANLSADPGLDVMPRAGVTMTCASSIKPEPIAWLWGGWLARGKVHVVAGAPGSGKTTAAVALAATLTIGGRWPDGTKAPIGDVLLWSGEDDPRDTLVPRLIAAGANLDKVHFVDGYTDERGRRAFDPSTDTDALSARLAMMNPAPVLLIVDPLVSAVAGDSHKNAEVRRSLQPLVDLAQIRGVAVLGISHFSKGTQGREPTERVTGSLAFGALARIVLATAKLPDEQGGGRILVRAKSNLGIDSGGFGYDLKEVELEAYPGIFTTRVLWGDAIDGSARDLLAQADTQDGQDNEGGSRSDVEAFIRMCLADGPITVKQMQAECNGAGHSWDRVKRISNTIGVKKRKDGYQGDWKWALPRVQESPKGSNEPAKGSKERTQNSVHSLRPLLPLHHSTDAVEVEA